jgi:hypothetical protein
VRPPSGPRTRRARARRCDCRRGRRAWPPSARGHASARSSPRRARPSPRRRHPGTTSRWTTSPAALPSAAPASPPARGSSARTQRSRSHAGTSTKRSRTCRSV